MYKLETWMYRVYRAESTDYSDQDVHTCYYRMYNHVDTGCTKFRNVQTENVQNLEMYNHVLPDVQPRATECTKKKFFETYQNGI